MKEYIKEKETETLLKKYLHLEHELMGNHYENKTREKFLMPFDILN